MLKWVDHSDPIPDPECYDQKEVMSFMGLAVFYAQSLESNLVWLASLVNLSEPTILTEESLGAASGDMQRRTMGQLFRAVRDRVPVPDALDAELANALDARNRLIHGFFIRRKNDYESEYGRREMIAELRKTAEILKSTNQTVARIVLTLSEILQEVADS